MHVKAILTYRNCQQYFEFSFILILRIVSIRKIFVFSTTDTCRFCTLFLHYFCTVTFLLQKLCTRCSIKTKETYKYSKLTILQSRKKVG